ncbi:MAG TPA: acyclic terpene utilization AtuA family protein [Thermoanaerobaculia bacterium]|nr:acyclic terpene utilization AtuA family protein [Thermoanaerobaculia bacterium]
MTAGRGRVVRVGNGQGFWGDNVDAPVDLLRGGPIDYVGMDYLAEVTLSIMMRQKLKDPSRGYATDFVAFVRRVLPELVARNVRIVTNAGGLNPAGARRRIFELARELGVTGLRIGVVEGDDLLPRLAELTAGGHELRHMETGEPLAPILDQVTSANAYLGAWPVVEALAQGAHIVLCGRVTDTALALAPLAHEHGWGRDDWDRLAAGTVAGHVIECGPQCTGGNFSRWWEVPDLWNVGFPLVEGHADGSFVVTKHEGTGGMVTVETVAEQLVYEMGDPREYLTPDVTADFTSIRLEQEGRDRVRASGIRGRPNTPYLKISASHLAGYKASGQLTISGPRAVDKARLCAEMVWKRLQRAGVTFPPEQREEELVGTGACLPDILGAAEEPPEVVLRLGVRDPDRARVERFGMELAPLVTSGPPGVTGFAGGRPKPQEVVAYWPALVAREVVEEQVRVTVEAV